ncbi:MULTISPECIES: ATP-binding protein [unclassified Devosia]|uniref:ATP-binding protein n=1 Tax=unclassified Devosia TaxID=196773 RepID=UPI0025BF675A|nr:MULTISPECIES: ATP-binding protein [unclassified Devosia]
MDDLLFDGRFLERHAGAIISDPAVAIVELVANCWDAYATEVEIEWPNKEAGRHFSIADNGHGMTAADFSRRWKTIDYNRLVEQGTRTQHPNGHLPDRRPYGRNGRGRYAAFRFGDPYFVTTWRNGTEATYEVFRGPGRPFDVRLLKTTTGVNGHGTRVFVPTATGVGFEAERVREILGTRFLADPNFSVSVDGVRVTFDDVPTNLISEALVEVPEHGLARIVMVETNRTDRTTLQHGIAWRVGKRLVGTPNWIGLSDKRILDGRSADAKRYTFIVFADFLEEAVSADWTGFDAKPAWEAARPLIHAKIQEMLSLQSEEKRTQAKADIRDTLGHAILRLPPLGRERWDNFVDQVIDKCPTISPSEVQQVAEILANLEISSSKYGLVSKLHTLVPGDLDQLDAILSDWSVATAKIALDEIQARLKLLAELDQKLRDKNSDEVGDLQPLFERSLWVFGPEFESIEFTSNRGMTKVIQELFGSDQTGSRLRPDFVIVPDGSVGFYSRDAYDDDHEVIGVARLVVAELKRAGVPIGSDQKGQAWEYVKELVKRGLVTKATRVTCFVLGDSIDDGEADARTEMEGRVVIQPVTYETFIRRAEKRMLGLREKLKNAPFLWTAGVDPDKFVNPEQPAQSELDVDTPQPA